MRYSKQILFEKFNESDQKKLSKSKIAIVGVGAIGSVSSELLARAGIGNLKIIDRDFIELSNLQRQSLFTEKDINLPKAIAAKRRLKKINSDVKIESYTEDLNSKNTENLLKGADLILDGTDNLETRFLINDFSLKFNIPWIYASAIGSKGATMNIIPKKTPCFRCIFKKIRIGLETCDTSGILNTTSTQIASIQSLEALKILLNKDTNNNLIYFDAWNQKIDKIKIKKDENCKACNKNYEFLDKRKEEIVSYCGGTAFQIKPKGKIDLKELEKRLTNIGNVNRNEYILHFSLKNKNFSVFRDGRAIIKNVKNEREAKSLYSKFIGN